MNSFGISQQRDPDEALLEEIEVIVRIGNAVRERAGPDASPERRKAAMEELLAEGGEFRELADRMELLEERGEAKLLENIIAGGEGDEEAAERFPRISVWKPGE